MLKPGQGVGNCTVDETATIRNQYMYIITNVTWPRGYKTFFVLNSVEHEISNAHKYKNINKFSFL